MSEPICMSEPRRTILLDGTWEVAEGTMDRAPERFERRVAVPGLVDRSIPAFDEVGVKSAKREAFWYRRAFRLDGPIPEVARLKVWKAMFGTRVILNGVWLGDRFPSFTSGYFDVQALLKPGDNAIVIRVGAMPDAVPRPIPAGADEEKVRFTPGIFDSVELILSGAPHIARIQTAPDVEKKSVAVHAWVMRHAGISSETKLAMTVREAVTGRIVGKGICVVPSVGDGPELMGAVNLPIENCRLWSPEDPFLYEIEARGESDVLRVRFGMRSFRFDPETGRAVLNGEPYFLRGSNVTLYRFFEDGERGDKPWREEWVRRLHKACRGMHWNCLRYCIGFPPEFWYRIADEEGLLIQDEFPIWNMEVKEGDFDADELAGEFTEWMQERWNHPCVVIWDACNETNSPVIAEAIAKVRDLDLSDRPWDNGWGPPGRPSDVWEQHPYHFFNAQFKLADIAADPGTLGRKPGGNPIVVNEYGWLWLNRDGTPTTLTKDLYANLLGPDSTTEQRRHLYARYLAAETEFWRSHRACAGILHFCVLGYSRPGDKPRPEGGATSDHWLDVEKLTWEPEFYTYVRDSFAPVGLMIDAWASEYAAGSPQEFPVVVINDLHEDWNGEVRFRLAREGATVRETTRPCVVQALGELRMTFVIDIPEQAGAYQVEAALVQPGAEPVRSLRDFAVGSLGPATLEDEG